MDATGNDRPSAEAAGFEVAQPEPVPLPVPIQWTVEVTVHHSRFSLGELHVRPGETVRFVLRNTDPIPTS